MAINKVNVSTAVKSSVGKEKLLKEIDKESYELFLKRNDKHGNDLQDWLEAERLVKKQYKLK
ncbi:MAG: hypothetical protein A2452_06725 [Candidatus Firestonebacteria bacterium RIFOXYC2_FULL_39_67]|nr:MAG: hypothetical protein A2452_06725 [Candidatus Firestonebacteria bacterium RIFOXYC2_FULL_39_67]